MLQQKDTITFLRVYFKQAVMTHSTDLYLNHQLLDTPSVFPIVILWKIVKFKPIPSRLRRHNLHNMDMVLTSLWFLLRSN